MYYLKSLHREGEDLRTEVDREDAVGQYPYEEDLYNLGNMQEYDRLILHTNHDYRVMSDDDGQ